MNKKTLIVTMIALIMGVVTGCRITPETAKVISQNAGLASAVTWIAYDNPNIETKSGVVEVLGVIETGVTNVQSGKTYSEVIYPIVSGYVSTATNIPSQYKPMVLAGSIATLNGVDLLFAMHPEWRTNEVVAQDCSIAFIRGAKSGLQLPESDPVIKQAKIGSIARVKVMNK
jgi:hypothetical protein